LADVRDLIENYEALKVYELAKALWAESIELDNAPELVERWEGCDVASIVVHRGGGRDLAYQLLWLTVGSITELHLGPQFRRGAWSNKLPIDEEYRLTSPKASPKEFLAGKTVGDIAGKEWGPAHVYEAELSPFVFVAVYGVVGINALFLDRFDELDESELSRLPRLVERVVEAQMSGSQVHLWTKDRRLVEQFVAAADELEVTRFGHNVKARDLLS
jgi:hypothetical protein